MACPHSRDNEGRPHTSSRRAATCRHSQQTVGLRECSATCNRMFPEQEPAQPRLAAWKAVCWLPRLRTARPVVFHCSAVRAGDSAGRIVWRAGHNSKGRIPVFRRIARMTVAVAVVAACSAAVALAAPGGQGTVTGPLPEHSRASSPVPTIQPPTGAADQRRKQLSCPSSVGGRPLGLRSTYPGRGYGVIGVRAADRSLCRVACS